MESKLEMMRQMMLNKKKEKEQQKKSDVSEHKEKPSMNLEALRMKLLSNKVIKENSPKKQQQQVEVQGKDAQSNREVQDDESKIKEKKNLGDQELREKQFEGKYAYSQLNEKNKEGDSFEKKVQTKLGKQNILDEISKSEGQEQEKKMKGGKIILQRNAQQDSEKNVESQNQKRVEQVRDNELLFDNLNEKENNLSENENEYKKQEEEMELEQEMIFQENKKGSDKQSQKEDQNKEDEDLMQEDKDFPDLIDKWQNPVVKKIDVKLKKVKLRRIYRLQSAMVQLKDLLSFPSDIQYRALSRKDLSQLHQKLEDLKLLIKRSSVQM